MTHYFFEGCKYYTPMLERPGPDPLARSGVDRLSRKRLWRRILFVYSRESSFVAIDRALLAASAGRCATGSSAARS